MKPTDYIILESAIAERILTVWDNPAQSIALAVYSKEYDKAREIVYGLDLPLSGLTPYITAVTKACTNFGAVMAQAEVSSNLNNPFIDDVVNRFETSLTVLVADSIKEKWLEAIDALQLNPETFYEVEEKVKIVKADTKKESFIKDFISFGDNSAQLIRMLSGLHTNRLSTWGFVGEAVTLGFDKYKLSAIIDSKTSYFCKNIANGKEFYVEDARHSITRILESNPEDMKALQPWVKATKANLAELELLTSSELTQRGLHIPPFHPWCRTILMRLDAIKYYFNPTPLDPSLSAEYIEEKGVTVDLSKLPLFNALNERKEELTKKIAEALGVKATPKAIKNFNGSTKTELSETLAEILGQDSYTFTETTAKDFTQALTAGKDGAIKIQAEKKDVKVNAYIDGVNGIIGLNNLALQGKLDDMVGELKTTLKGLVNVGKANNLKTLQVKTAGQESLVMTGLGLTADDLGVASATMASALQSLLSIGVKIPEDDLAMLIAIINSPKFGSYGLELIARYPLEIGGKTIAEILFANTKIVANLSLEDGKALDKFLRLIGED